MEQLTKETFKTKVFDFEAGKEWKFSGELPCVIDFYADWCGPCRMLAPTMQAVSEKYTGELNVYKVNTDEQPEIAAAFNIESIPSVLFVPVTGTPQMAVGALSMGRMEKAIGEILGIKKQKNMAETK